MTALRYRRFLMILFSLGQSALGQACWTTNYRVRPIWSTLPTWFSSCAVDKLSHPSGLCYFIPTLSRILQDVYHLRLTLHHCIVKGETLWSSWLFRGQVVLLEGSAFIGTVAMWGFTFPGQSSSYVKRRSTFVQISSRASNNWLTSYLSIPKSFVNPLAIRTKNDWWHGIFPCVKPEI